MNAAWSHRRSLHRIVAACLFGCIAAPAAAQDSGNDDEWHFIVAPYLWAAGVSGDLNLNRPPPGGDINFDQRFVDVVDKLDGAFEIHMEAQRGHWGAFTDFSYLGLSDTRTHPRFELDTNLHVRLFELAGVWNPGGDTLQGLEIFAGLRYLDVNFSTTFAPHDPIFPSYEVGDSKSYSDFMLGMRYTWQFNDRWGLTVRGDGSWGEDNSTWNASAIASYAMHNGSWYFGYRYLDYQLEPRDHSLSVATHGVLVGYGWRF